MSFRDSVESDNTRVFMNTEEFAEPHTVRYDGDEYRGVRCVISKLKQKERTTTMRDHAQGLYAVTAVFHCPAEMMDGNVPEKGARIQIDDEGFMKDYYVAQSACDHGMIRLELEAYDE